MKSIVDVALSKPHKPQTTKLQTRGLVIQWLSETILDTKYRTGCHARWNAWVLLSIASERLLSLWDTTGLDDP